jgi:hypothetical protein
VARCERRDGGDASWNDALKLGLASGGNPDEGNDQVRRQNPVDNPVELAGYG